MGKTKEIVIMPNHTINTAIRGARKQFFLESTGDEGLALNSESKSNLAQRWDVVATEDFPDTVRIMNRKTRTFLTLTDSDVGTFLSSSDPKDKGQQWHMQRDNRGNYSFASAFFEDEFDIKGVFTMSDNKNWKLSPSQELEDLRSDLEDGRTWRTLSPQNTSPPLLYGILGAYVAASTELVQWTGEWYKGAGFKFEAVNETVLEDDEESWHGYYKIVTHVTSNNAISTNLILTASSDSKVKQEEQKSGTGYDTQLWRLEQLKDGNYLIINKSTSQVIESTKSGVSHASLDSPVLKDYNYVSGIPRSPSSTNPPSSRRIKMGDSGDQGG
jgi:hypothetical protein